MKFSSLKNWWDENAERSSFAVWQRWIAALIVSVLFANTGLFSGAVYAQTFEVKLDDFRETALQDLEEYGLVNVIVENALYQDATLANHLQRYCERVQEALGVVCLITPWQGETPSRIVEALQQMYFEGVEVSGGIGKLVGVVLVGDVPLPVVRNGVESFPSHSPYTDLVQPAYVYDADQAAFIRSTVAQGKDEIWHGLIRPPGDDETRRVALREFFQKNAQFYEGDDAYTLVGDKIGFHDHFWENESFDNEAKNWYLKKLTQLDRLFNYRYTGDWLNELSGEATDRLAQFTSKTFPDSLVAVDGVDPNALDAELGFDPNAAVSAAASSASAVVTQQPDVEAYGQDRLENVVPDIYSPGPIRNLLKDYVAVVQRYVSGTSEILDVAGRRQSHETLASLITKMDKFYGSVVYLVNQEFEQYLYDQAEVMAVPFEMVKEHRDLNDFYTEEATDFLDSLKSQLIGTDYAPLGVDNNPKGNLREFGSKDYTHFVNGIAVENIQSAEHCMLERGSNFIADDGEVGKALSFNRKGNPLTSKDIEKAGGLNAKQEIERIYQEYGYCSYNVKDQCLPGAAKRPLFDFAAAEFATGDIDYRKCFGQDGPPAPKDSERALFYDIPSIINHVQPTGGVVASVLEKQLAHFLPIDAVRHASFYLGGASQYLDQNVARLRYPNFFDLESNEPQAVLDEVEQVVEDKERELRKLRVESNWKRYARYVALSTPVPGRDDFWNYHEIDGFEDQFARYKADVLTILRREFDPQVRQEDFELVERYLTSDDLSEDATTEIEALQQAYFSNAFAKQSFDMVCEYTFDVPPIEVSLDILKDDTDSEDLYNPVLLADAIQPPDFNPPAITRKCDNKVAKQADKEFASLREFYNTREGGTVNLAILHKSDKFVEILDPVAVALYFTPPPPPLPPNFNMQAAIALFVEQATSLEGELEPLSYVSHTVTPVPLALPGELESLYDQYKTELTEALQWLNLSIEAKHKEGLSLLTKDKEMVYLALDGDADHIDFGFDGLKGVFEEDEPSSGSGAGDVLDEVSNRLDELKAQQEEQRQQRAIASRNAGDRQSECGDSVPLLQWPGAVECWLNEIVSGPLIEMPPREDPEESSNDQLPTANSQRNATTPGQISVSQTVLSLGDRIEASLGLPLETEIRWEGEGSVRVEAIREGKGMIIPERLGEGTVRARYEVGSGQEVAVLSIRVTGVQAELKQQDLGDLRIGSADVIVMEVSLQDQAGDLQRTSGELQIQIRDTGVVQAPQRVNVVDGFGTFELRPGRKAQQTQVRVFSDTVAPSDWVLVDTLPGAPVSAEWFFGDQVMGIDQEMEGVLRFFDREGNLSTGEGVRYQLEWDKGLVINGQSGGEGAFFAVAGNSPLKLVFDESLLSADELEQVIGYAGNASAAVAVEDAQALAVRLVSVDQYEELDLPEALDVDLRQDYRVQIQGLPEEVGVGQPIRFSLRVEGEDGALPLQEKVFIVESEYGGEERYQEVQMKGAEASVELLAPATSGTQTITIDDPDFGTVTASVKVFGRNADHFVLESSQYANGAFRFTVTGKDVAGNTASLAGEIGKLTIIGDGAVELGKRSVAIEEDRWEQVIAMPQQPDRIQVRFAIEAFEQEMTREFALEQQYSAADLAQLDWEAPFMVLAGSAFGDYRNPSNVAQSILYGAQSRVQSLVTEVTPHHGGQRLARIWPSGRLELGPEAKVEMIIDALKPVAVFSSENGEVGRLTINPSRLPSEVITDQGFAWTRQEGYGKAILVPQDASYRDTGTLSGELLSPQGQVLVRFQQGGVSLLEPSVQVEAFADEGDVLVLEFRQRSQTLARWYLHFTESAISQDRPAALQWNWSQDFGDRYQMDPFYGGESTQGPMGLALLDTAQEVRYAIGEGRSGLDDVRDKNGQGFVDQDKSSLSFLAGSTAGESMQLQGEGMIVLGDPVMSLRYAKHEMDDGTLVSAVQENALAAASDFSIGQMLYTAQKGKITHLLRADVELDGEDDLLVVLDQGQRTVVQYLQGEGEGFRWGEVSELLDLGKGVKQIETVQGRHLLVLYENGSLILYENVQGRYRTVPIDFSATDFSRVTTFTVRDFDQDRRDDLLFMTGKRQLWVWYGLQGATGYRFGSSESERQLLRLMSVQLQDVEHLKAAAWIHTPSTPRFEANCREDRVECQGQYFRAFTGLKSDQSFLKTQEEVIDRLGTLLTQSEETGFQEQETGLPPQEFLVRLDQSGIYANAVNFSITNANEGSQLNMGQELDLEATVTIPRSADPFALYFDLGSDFALKGNVECDGCDEGLHVLRDNEVMWKLEGELISARTVTLRFTVEYLSLPDFSFQVMQTNDDEFPDIGINIPENSSGRITVFESRGPRQYLETLFGEATATSSSPASESLSDLMRGIGFEGKSQDEIKNALLGQQSAMEALTGDLLDSVHEDNNVDGYPDLYQENPSLFPDAVIQSSENKQEVSVNDQLGMNSTPSLDGLLEGILSSFIPKTFAQAQNVDTFNTFKSDSFSNLDNLALMFDNIESDVQMVVKALKCSRGCLPLPINFAFLAPGPINIMGTPAGFDPGIPIFGVSPAPFFVWPPLVPYQATQFRIYLSPTLTLGLGIGICLGPYLLGQCFVFAIPIGSLLGSESVCDAIKEGLSGMMRGIQTTVGNVTQGLANSINQTGVIKAQVPKTPTADIESIIGVSLGGSTHNKGPTPEEPKVFLNPIPDLFVNWWDRQWEEVVNSLTDLPDITVRLPDFGSSLDPDYFDKLSEKVSGDTFLNLQELYDVINSLPAVTLNPDVIQIQVPWIEPGILRKIEQSLYQFLYSFLLEFAAFLHSFNLPCNITVSRHQLFKEIRARAESQGISEATEQEIARVQALLENTSGDITQAERALEGLTDEVGYAQASVELRRAYFTEMREKQEKVENLNSQYDQLEAELNRLQEPQKITEILPVFGDIMSETMTFWQQQKDDFTAAALSEGVKKESAEALRTCAALDIALKVGVDVNQFVQSIQKNLEALEQWKEFPRKLAKYLNALEFYMQEVVKLIDQITSIVLNWWTEFERKLDLWIDVIFSYQELVALIKLIIDILKGYNKKCGLCTSDRLTLKELILKLVFGAIPKFPIIDFPNWPDIRLDFSDVQFAIDVTLPVFEVKTVDLRWPELPDITFPRFEDIDLDVALGAKAALNVTLPEVPLVVPSPPNLPPLQPLPNLPQINLPNLPPAPEVPDVLEQLLPLMRIIQTILDIWCLINKSLIPIDEKQLKTQIENLTNRSANLILPIDLMLTLDLFPGDLLTNLVPFDTIDVTTKFQAGVNIEPIPNVQETIDQQFHQPMNIFTNQVDLWIQQLRNAVQQGTGLASGELQDTLGTFQVDGINLGADVNVNAGLQPDGTSIESEFPELFNYLPAQPSGWQQELIEQRKDQLISQNEQLKDSLIAVHESLQALDKDPESLMQSLASLSADNILVAGEPTLLKQQVSQEKRQALLDPKNFVERQVEWFDRDGLIAQVNESGDALQQVQQELLDTSSGLTPEYLGVVAVRNGQASRLQDYPLSDPVVNVWDEDILLAYEDAVYVKASDNRARRHQPYQGRVLQSSLDQFQRSKVHQLSVESTTSSSAGNGSATVVWTWDDTGADDVELTVWDSVAGAQRLDQDHLRFYLDVETRDTQRLEVITPGTLLEPGRSFLTARDVRMRFGQDLLFIPRGVVFTIPSFDRRVIELDGQGQVQIENVEGKSWDIQLGSEVTVSMTGLVDMELPSSQKIRVPAFQARPYVRAVDGEVSGALRLRQEVVSGEAVPSGVFAATASSVLVEEQTGMTLRMARGMTYPVSASEDWKLESGRGTVVVSEDLEYQQVKEGFVIMDDELLEGSYVVQDGSERIEVLPGQEVVWSHIRGPRFEVTLPAGNYYGRIREQEGLRGFSPIVHAAAQVVLGDSQVLPGVERIPVAIYTPVEVDASSYVIGQIPAESHHWSLNGSDALVSGTIYRHPGFDQVGPQKLELFVRDGDDEYQVKTFSLDVFLPELTIDPTLYEQTRVIQVETDPIAANIPIGIVGEREGVQDWLKTGAVEGTRADDRYFTNAQGQVQLAPLPALEGLNVIIDGNMNVARLYPTGRVVLHEEYQEECQNEALLDSDGFLKFRVSCLTEGSLAQKFESRMVPHRDTDVTIVEDFGAFDTGVVVRAMQSSLQFVSLGNTSSFVAGGAQLLRSNGQVLMVVAPDGQIELNEQNLALVVKPEEDPAAALTWQLVQNGALLAEIRILGPEDVDVIDPLERDILPGDQDQDGMLDRWEATYGVQDPTADPDTDGLTNLEEFQKGTNPRVLDTDGDGLSDGEEVDPLAIGSAEMAIQFSDVPESNPYHDAILGLARFGFIQGYADGSFKPDQPVTRAEAIKILMSVINCENCEFPGEETKREFDPTLKGFDYFVQFHDGVFNQSSEDPLKNFAFSESDVVSKDTGIRTYLDVDINDWFYYCVEIATDLGLINGYRGFEEGVNALGSYLPERNVNIAELMKMVIEAVGDRGKNSDRVYAPAEGWWNDPSNNYLARAEEDLQLLLNDEDYADPLRKATRAEVAYAAYRVLRENGVLDFDGDGVSNQADACPCQAGQSGQQDIPNGCPALFEPRKPERLFEGIEIMQACPCLVLVDADLAAGSRFFAVITGKDEEEVLTSSNTVP